MHRTPLGNISVIVESSDLKDDDDAEDMVVMETKGSNNDFLENGDYKIDNQLMQEHGHLVAQILETQRELVNTDNVDVIPKKVDIVRKKYSLYAKKLVHHFNNTVTIFVMIS